MVHEQQQQYFLLYYDYLYNESMKETSSYTQTLKETGQE
jgi:hypothetical protein